MLQNEYEGDCNMDRVSALLTELKSRPEWLKPMFEKEQAQRQARCNCSHGPTEHASWCDSRSKFTKLKVIS